MDLLELLVVLLVMLVDILVVMLVDKVLGMLATPGAAAVILGAVDWMGAFDRVDPTISISKLINMGVRSSLIPILIEFLEDRQMSVKYNGASSTWHSLVGGGPQGSWIGQQCYITASDDAGWRTRESLNIATTSLLWSWC